MKSLPLPENSIVLRFAAPSAAAAASSVVFASCAQPARAPKAATASTIINVFFIPPPAMCYLTEPNRRRQYMSPHDPESTFDAKNLKELHEFAATDPHGSVCNGITVTH